MDNRLKELEKQYKDVPIPKELDAIVEASLNKKPQKRKKHSPKWVLSSVAAAALFTAGLNVSPTLARNLADIPVLGSVVEVLTFVNYELEEESYSANIEVPKINGESNDIATLNEKYAAEGKALYEQFSAEIKEMEQAGGGNLSVDSGYIIQTDTEKLLSVGRYVVKAIGSAYEVIHYDTIDKQKEIVITLPSLFKDERYISLISEYIIGQMRQDMDSYWISDAGIQDERSFKTIKADQNFYITEEGKLVIVFDEYEVAPGSI